MDFVWPTQKPLYLMRVSLKKKKDPHPLTLWNICESKNHSSAFVSCLYLLSFVSKLPCTSACEVITWIQIDIPIFSNLVSIRKKVGLQRNSTNIFYWCFLVSAHCFKVSECELKAGPSTHAGTLSVHLFLPWVCVGSTRGTHSSCHQTRKKNLHHTSWTFDGQQSCDLV